ncbi:hypothetical protein Slin15195_G094710 [Septoria linicola]|uniref:Uncharacterized protein n=1 Tax=Septoria linicola TaxID=215465 RepID=A0A9Q9AUL5_9PEZI|nr:hypothetical protein Slin15195_G094710 [Septoria linicola]
MGRSKSKAKRPSGKIATTSDEKPSQDLTMILTIADLRANQDLWFKTRLLIYDLYNMSNDKSCEDRTLQTTDPLYISTPYFSDAEAAVVKNVIVDPISSTTLEQAFSSSLENFFEKRRASGDWRPCGPHDMVPVYLACLGMEKREIEEEGFVARARRWRAGKS